MAVKRKSLPQANISKKARKEPSPSTDDEVDQFASHSTLVDPMIDPQGSDSDGSDDDGEEHDEDEEMDDDVPEFTGMEVEEEAAPKSGPSTSRNLYKAPTLAELDQLRNAEASGGTTFSLQLDELLRSTLLSTTPAPALSAFLSSIHDLVHSLPKLNPVAPRKAAARLAKGSKGLDMASLIPFPGPEELSPLADGAEPKWTLGFEAPTEVLVAGSWVVCGGYKKAKGEAGGVDVVVVMPESMFSAKDRTAYRYFHKRAHYLAVIAQALRKASADKSSPLHGAEVSWANLDPRRPIITVAAGKAQGLKHALQVRVHAAIAPGTFPLTTLYPSKSLIRKGAAGDDDEAAGSTPSPNTAASILQDMLYKPNLLHLNRLSQTLGTSDRVADKFLALWRIWAGRRGLPRSRGGSGWFASMMLGWIVDGGEIGGAGGVRSATKRHRGLGKGLGAWGALRAAWEFLAHTDFEKTPVFMAGDAEIPITEWTGAFGDVFVHPSGTVNIFGEWEKGDVELLRYHARETLAMLEDNAADHFADVFLNDQTLGPAAFDEYMVVDVAGADEVDADIVTLAEQPLAIERQAHTAADVVRRGLTDRVRLVHTRVLDDSTFSVGLLLNGADATRVLDLGPKVDDEEGCAAFKELWGERSDLRRFKDGSIAESVVWSVARPEEAVQIPRKAATWLIQHHLGEDVRVTSLSSEDGWLTILQVPESVREAINTVGAEKLGFRPVMDGYDALYKTLKDIDSEMPLAILNVTPASEMLRYAATFVPHPIDIARAASAPSCISFSPVAEVLLQFESSPRWPDDLAAIQKLKLALFEKLARILQSRLRGSRVDIALDPEVSDIDDAASLEIMMPQGVAFRIRIHHPREKLLLERALEPPAPGIPRNLPPAPRRLVLPALARHTARFEHAPSHHAALAPLHHRFPSFSTAVRLLKRWAASHMLSAYLTPEALELLTARTYLSPGTLAPPSSASTGFLRTLSYLASWDWRSQPAFVPLRAVTRDAASASGRPRFPETERASAMAAFTMRRRSDKDMHNGAWSVVTEDDDSGLRWTADVTPVVAGRVAALANASLALVRSVNDEELDVSTLFVTPLEHYDAVLHLYAGVRAGEAVHPDESLWETSGFRNLTASQSLRPGFDPVTLLAQRIRKTYGDAILVSHDVHGSRALGLLWNPVRSVPRAFKPLLPYSAQPAKSEAALVSLNRDAVLAEISRLGSGMIERIERRG